MAQVEIKPAGWYLGLRYMTGEGFVARVPEKIGAEGDGAQFIFADDVLLETTEWKEVLRDWWRALSIGGHMILWLTDCRYGGDEGLARVTLDDVRDVFCDCGGWRLWEADTIEGHIFVVWEKRGDAAQWQTPWRKQPKHLLVARMGAFGDALMAGSVLPALKEQGWHISFLTREDGAEILRKDPHIDEMIVLREGQVEEKELPYYWQAWAGRVDRFINLTHSVEGELLKRPERADYFWSDEQRRSLCARSYLRQTHALASVPGPYCVRFFPDQGEKVFAENFASRIGSYVLWCLRGSAVHKWWPYTAEAICQVLAHSDAAIVLTGGLDAVSMVEPIMSAVRNYYGDTKRVHLCVGTHSIRSVCALAQNARVVVGPETGVMNAVSMESVPKVVFLSHSAPENLTDDWVNAEGVRPAAACYPCHRMHFDHTWCPLDEKTGAALCAASIGVRQVVDAVQRHLKRNVKRIANDGF